MKRGRTLRIHRSIGEFNREDWNRLTGPDTIPFLEWDWLSCLEESGSISPETGWYPLHLGLWEGERLAAAAPLYLKTSGGGEYVWDYFWEEAAASLGRAWYPKLVGAPAATPAEGYRFLWDPAWDGREATALLLGAAEDFCRRNHIPGFHLLFTDPLWASQLPPRGYVPWEHSHYLWENTGFAGLEDYLALFNKNQRRNIRREYHRHEEQGITIRIIPGEEAGPELFQRMFELYSLTNDKFFPWDARWVNEEFFQLLEKRCPGRTAFVEARRVREAQGLGEAVPGGGPAGEGFCSVPRGGLVALAFLVRKGDRLWGRFWGAYEEIRDLHFAVCYYAPLDYCIREGIRFFDPGAGSPHKIRRGFRACLNRSYHKFFDPFLRRLFQDNIPEVNRYEREQAAALNEELPFKDPQDEDFRW